MIWFTSDTHFGHKNIAGPKSSNWPKGYRDFDNVEDMNQELIDRINEYVDPNDTLWHLGDFSFAGGPQRYFDMINCNNIHLIMGNHDKYRKLKAVSFKSIDHYKEIYLGKTKVCMSHYAQRVWNKSHHGSLHLYGHSHNTIDNNWGRSMDIGVDAIYYIFGEYRPISEKEVLDLLMKRPTKFVDHHNPETGE